MDNLQLQPSEGIIELFENVSYQNEGKSIAGKIILTNLNIFFEYEKGFFSKHSEFFVLPLKEIKVIDGSAQIVLSEKKSDKLTDMIICTKEDQIVFTFDRKDKKVAYHLADIISKKISNKGITKKRENSLAYKTGSFIKEGITSFTEGLFSKEKKMISKKCPVCQAIIKGYKQEETTCEFCGNTYTL